ncbi:hypothetical protein [Enterococcus wangshanyuanii]|uniref:Barstar (barnase inhibitor) domain-containing protein n=2 Tax=Enterococcus wangshanyuanii TaxID=2005703 RepID=A0ABQ1PIF9_9ENTE|nr:hypothetical protein [Enterococcus wangshanyuanii]GGC97589.1 hypothetical protein GCM10011573_28910 [Enterococcus wangshanyuanii]
MKNIEEFINEWEECSKRLHSEHIDFFINKDTFNYEDCLVIIDAIRKELENRGINGPKIMIRIQCGQSKRIQDWGELFWQLVDANTVPPELFISNNNFLDSSAFSQQIKHPNQGENIENYIVFYPVEDGFTRCLNIVEKEVPYV